MQPIDNLIQYIEKSIRRSQDKLRIHMSTQGVDTTLIVECLTHKILGMQQILEKGQELKANMETDDGWISVEVEIPPHRREILIFHSGRYVVYGFRDGEGYYTPTVISYDYERVELEPIGPGRVTHWKPLPSPPKGEK